jgi:hypothetical protein
MKTKEAMVPAKSRNNRKKNVTQSAKPLPQIAKGFM